MNRFNIPSNIKAVLFDLDGVIFNTEDLAHDVFSSLSERHHYQFTEKDHRNILGSAESYWSAYMVDRLNSDLSAHQFAELFWRELGICTEKNLRLMPSVLNCFEGINSIGLKKCLVTSSRRDYVVKMLDKFDILDEFVYIVASDDYQIGKPDPEPYLQAVHYLDCDGEDCVVIEDSINGVRSGKAAGCFVIAVPTTHADGIDYSEADQLIHGLDEIFV